jgi:hypothetical protein
MTTEDPLNSDDSPDYYKRFAIQPVVFCHANKLPGIESQLIGYDCRHGKKNGAADIKKAIHFLQILLKLEYPEEAE